jgi:hypothetical protein
LHCSDSDWLVSALHAIETKIKEIQGETGWKRLTTFWSDPLAVKNMRSDLDSALALFQVYNANHTYPPISCIVQLEFTTTTAIDTANIHDMIKDDDVAGILGKLERKLGTTLQLIR